MKVAINRCFGGFSLSPLAIKRLAELNGKQCYFFTYQRGGGEIDIHKHSPIALEDIRERSLFFSAYDIPNPDEALPSTRNWHEMTQEQRRNANAEWDAHSLDSRPKDRTDPKLIQVIEELGDKANGACAELAIVEIPDGVEFEIDEYDGNESIHEVHRSWR